MYGKNGHVSSPDCRERNVNIEGVEARRGHVWIKEGPESTLLLDKE